MNNKPFYQKNRKQIVFFIFLSIVIGLLANIIISFISEKNIIFAALRKINFLMFAIPFLLYCLNYVINTFRLKLVFHQFKQKISFRDGMINSILGTFFNYLSPMAAGGQPFQVYHLQTLGFDSKIATNAIFSRFVENAIVTIMIIFLCIPRIINMLKSLSAGAVLVVAGLSVTVIMAVIFFIILINPEIIGKMIHRFSNLRLARRLKRFPHRKHREGERPSERFLKWCYSLKEEIRILWSEKFYIVLLDTVFGMITVFIQSFSLFYIFYKVMGLAINPFEMYITYVILWQVIFYVPTPGASGTIEAGFGLVFSELTGASYLTSLVIVIWRFATYYAHIGLGAIIFFCIISPGGKRKKELNSSSRETNVGPIANS